MTITTKELTLILLALGHTEDSLTAEGKKACERLGAKIATLLEEWIELDEFELKS